MKPISPNAVSIQGALLMMLCTLSLQALAESTQETAPAPANIQAQPTTKAWLELQSSGEAASKQPQTLSGPAMERIHERYLKNFTHPIPPSYEHAERISN